MLALGLVLLRTEERRISRALDDRLLAEAQLIARAAAPVLREGAIDRVDPVAKELGAAAGVRVTLIATDGTVLGDSGNDPRALDNHAGRPEVLAALRTGVGRSDRRSVTEGRDFSYVAVPVRAAGTGEALGVTRVALPRTTVAADLRRSAFSVGAAALTAALIAGLVAIVIARAVTEPLARLRRAARGLAAGAFDQRVPAGGSTEVAGLGAAFNEMAEQLRETVSRLAHEHSRIEAVLASSANALAALGRDGVVRYLNPAAEALFGHAVGRPFLEVARDHELGWLLRAALARDERTAAPIHLDLPDAWFQATVNPITGGGEWAVLVVLQDITEIRRAETTRRDFVANVSHELRTPLAGIKAVVETLRDGARDDPVAAEEFLGRVDAEVDRLVHLVEELLQLARIESGAAPMVMVDVEPEKLLAGSVERFAHLAERGGVALAMDLPADLPPIRADPERLGQALGNLIHNALKFTAAGGRVTLAAEHRHDDLCIAVTDTGSGIDPADLPRIFERFYVADRARSRRGTGLGLAIAKHVVRAHGGTIEAQSKPGRGSTFTITLPLNPTPAAAGREGAL